uniref:Uncharacterized protein n=1 Tax=Parascaris univalens TaxID=6257 RepID=A0A915C178_PARUN
STFVPKARVLRFVCSVGWRWGESVQKRSLIHLHPRITFEPMWEESKISLNDIAQLKFPPGAMRHSAALTSPNSAHTTLHCHFEPARTQILHIPMNNIRSQKDTIRLKAVNELCGTVFITENEALDAAKEADTSAGIVQNGCDKHVTCEPSFEIHSIRKKPKLPLEGVRERVRAFGVVSKKKRDKLPNLISNS